MYINVRNDQNMYLNWDHTQSGGNDIISLWVNQYRERPIIKSSLVIISLITADNQERDD
jgi:hypothetical protein